MLAELAPALKSGRGKISTELASPWGVKLASPWDLLRRGREGPASANMARISCSDMHECWAKVNSKNRQPLLTGWRLGATAAGRCARACGSMHDHRRTGNYHHITNRHTRSQDDSITSGLGDLRSRARGSGHQRPEARRHRQPGHHPFTWAKHVATTQIQNTTGAQPRAQEWQPVQYRDVED